MENQRVGDFKDEHTYSAFLTKEELERLESVREKTPELIQEKTEIIPRRNRKKTEVSPTSDRDKTENNREKTDKNRQIMKNNHNNTVSLPSI